MLQVFLKASMWKLVHTRAIKNKHIATLDLVFSLGGKKHQAELSVKCCFELERWWLALKYWSSARDTHWGTTSTFCFSPWALHKTDALPIHPVLLPVSGVSDVVLKPYALLNSSRILPSCPIPAALCWPWTLGCHEGGLPASCVGSKYLHTPLSQVARRRGLDVLGYVKSNPPGRTFNWLSLLEQIFEEIYLRESFLTLLIQSQRQPASAICWAKSMCVS